MRAGGSERGPQGGMTLEPGWGERLPLRLHGMTVPPCFYMASAVRWVLPETLHLDWEKAEAQAAQEEPLHQHGGFQCHRWPARSEITQAPSLACCLLQIRKRLSPQVGLG